MRTFRVCRMKNGEWEGREDGEDAILIVAEDAERVREIVFSKARESGPSRVLVLDAGGTTIEERTFRAPRPKGYAGDWS